MVRMKTLRTFVLSGLATNLSVVAAAGRACENGTRPYSAWLADSVIARKDALLTADTEGDISLSLKLGLFQISVIHLKEYYDAVSCAKEDWDAYLKEATDSILPRVLNVTGDIEAPMDIFTTANGLYYQYEKSGDEKYKQGLDALRQAYDGRRRNSEGGFWFYNARPNLSYLDETYPLGAFTTIIKNRFEPTNETLAENLSKDLDLFKDHCHHDTGLLAHGYDASKSAPWSNKTTGASPYVWDRALGWYHMGLVELLYNTDEFGILNQTQRDDAYKKYYNLANTIINDVDEATGCWWQVMEHGGEKGNYIETSGSAMFTYSILKGVRLGYLTGNHPESGKNYKETAQKCYNWLLENRVVPDDNGALNVSGTVGVCTLEDPTYEYYTTQPLSYNSVLGFAPFVMASLEHEMAADAMSS
ncbi:cell wall glycosyl hydrolase YteR [Aspergillus saccharolyticus JOP 1030-1]|uniref:Cell wall glycosyl hydrolase YteR n=1 Tax=Aspergillus saccharolyticus JOP 1030-1 TaxID=1450539 RepID=A0A318ZPN7_9EURO|nr:cell wall glycosyl hydrolase YteR [Aspergillus saccharolyticus JOP 1030-1]PYH49559.1 cell wall glycosyl hydrolase YteR [Aspergillus saccharolyticus JOP 1030-1]